MLSPLRRAALAATLMLATGCAEEAARPGTKTPLMPSAAASIPAPPPAAVPPGHLARQDVDLVLTRLGLPWLFRRVMRKGTFDKAGKFAGWLLTGLPEEWSSVDLRPGDIVTSVNGLPLETPDDAWEAWKSVASAKEIRISLLRDGAPAQIIVPIDGAPTAGVIKALDQNTPPPRPQGQPRRGTITIGGGDEGEPEGD